jgi:hypothetical protein
MLKAAMLIGVTWTALSLLFCFAWARALTALSDSKCAGRRGFRTQSTGVSGVLRPCAARTSVRDRTPSVAYPVRRASRRNAGGSR